MTRKSLVLPQLISIQTRRSRRPWRSCETGHLTGRHHPGRTWSSTSKKLNLECGVPKRNGGKARTRDGAVGPMSDSGGSKLKSGVVERIGATTSAAICGFTPKTMRKLAKDGKIPGAALLGNCWRFDERRLRDWIRRQEAACLSVEETTSLSGTGSGTPASKFEAATCDEAYERLLGRKQKNGSPAF